MFQLNNESKLIITLHVVFINIILYYSFFNDSYQVKRSSTLKKMSLDESDTSSLNFSRYEKQN